VTAPSLIATYATIVPPDWADYNRHMTEFRYLQCFGEASDAFLLLAGMDGAYLAAHGSFFTVETHIRHLYETPVGMAIHVTTQVLAARGKTLHLFHQLHHDGGTLSATGEHMLVHVSAQTRRASLPSPALGEALARMAADHAPLPKPEGSGRAVGERKKEIG
jgi:carnitine 3-dehydrogenase